MTADRNPYSVGDFLRDAKREFQFLVDDFGFELQPSDWTELPEVPSSLPLTTGPISRALPRVRYRAAAALVSIDYDPRGKVRVLVGSPDPHTPRRDVAELASTAGGPEEARRYSGAYDRTTGTPGEVLGRLAEGLRKYGAPVLRGESAT
jgi:hypothetical protein